jgi:hemolysin III
VLFRRHQIKINRPEYFSFFSHVAGILGGFAGLLLLIVKSWGHSDLVIVSLVYGLATCCLFTFSALYHANKKTENATNVWRKLDHIAIFFMIAGTYTPICYIYLAGTWRWSMILVSWGFVIAGIMLKVFFIKAPRILSTMLYLLMGWLGVAPLRELWRDMPHLSFFLILGGGIAYSIGAIIYALKRPNPLPGVFGFHEIFHIMILLGASLHYIPVFLAVVARVTLS